uniref:DDE Tnp4 domain-containing protein n=1 Tax=Chenopodium quinoa TaxID=63459 RepID=A0A803ND90_CHEQI
MEDQLLKQPNGSEEVSPEVLGDSRFFPYFKDCIGALDGTHIRVKVASWEGSASNSRVFKNALSREDKLIIPQGGTNEPQYSLKTQTDIIVVCCILHNFLMGFDPDQSLIDEVDRELLDADNEECETLSTEEESKEGSKIRDSIAKQMWDDYVL